MELPTKAIWKKLSLHHNSIKSLNIKDQFVSDPQRASKFTLEAASLLLDYSKNKISEETIDLLCKLAEESKLQDKIEAMFEGEKINITEDRAVLHTALRNPNFKAKVLVDAIFDLELKREALIRSKSHHYVNVENQVFYEIDFLTDQAL